VKSELRVRDSLGGLAWNQRDDNVRVQDGGDASSTKPDRARSRWRVHADGLFCSCAERQKHLEPV
jgi:hypothetical protein